MSVFSPTKKKVPGEQTTVSEELEVGTDKTTGTRDTTGTSKRDYTDATRDSGTKTGRTDTTNVRDAVRDVTSKETGTVTTDVDTATDKTGRTTRDTETDRTGVAERDVVKDAVRKATGQTTTDTTGTQTGTTQTDQDRRSTDYRNIGGRTTGVTGLVDPSLIEGTNRLADLGERPQETSEGERRGIQAYLDELGNLQDLATDEGYYKAISAPAIERAKNLAQEDAHLAVGRGFEGATDRQRSLRDRQLASDLNTARQEARLKISDAIRTAAGQGADLGGKIRNIPIDQALKAAQVRATLSPLYARQTTTDEQKQQTGGAAVTDTGRVATDATTRDTGTRTAVEDVTARDATRDVGKTTETGRARDVGTVDETGRTRQTGQTDTDTEKVVRDVSKTTDTGTQTQSEATTSRRDRTGTENREENVITTETQARDFLRARFGEQFIKQIETKYGPSAAERMIGMASAIIGLF